MEEQGYKNEAVKHLVSRAPEWLQAIFIVCGMIFTLGILYSNILSLRTDVKPISTNTIKISILETKQAQMADNQRKLRQTNTRLADAVTKLSVATAELKGELEKEKR